MANKDKYSAKQMADAIYKSKGMLTIAARQLGCSYNTVRSYIDRYATVKEAYDEASEVTGDEIELTLLNKALGKRDDKGNWTQLPDTTALIFLAKTKLKHRGYVERNEVTGADGGAVRSVSVTVPAHSVNDANEILQELEKLGVLPDGTGTAINNASTE